MNKSPLSPVALLDLFFNPRRYFEDLKRLFRNPERVIVVWLCGITYTMGRVDSNIIKADLGAKHSGWATFGPWLTDSWLHYWVFVFGFGALNGMILWFLGGWWYRKRLEWSGAKEITPIDARVVYVYQDLVQSTPVFFIALVQTVLFSNYMEAWKADEYWSSTAILFILWSCFTSYKAASTVFSIKKWKGRLWFLILPLSIHVAVLGAVGTLYSMFKGHTG